MFRSCILTLLLIFAPASAYAAKLKVVASFSILGDIVSRVGGDNIEVTTLVGPDADAHTYEPTPDAVKALSNANLVIINGLGFEGWIGRLIVSSGYSGHVIVAAKEVTALTVSDNLDEDPHAWQSVTNVINYTGAIRDALSDADRGHSAQYKKNAEIYIHELNALEEWIQSQIATIEPKNRVVITTHDAFRYFGRYYNVTFLAPTGVTNESSPSAAAVAGIIDQMQTQQVRALFFENVSDDKIIKQLQHDGNAYIGGTLYSDALSAPNGPAPTYIALMKHNVTALVEGMRQNHVITAPKPPEDETSEQPISN